MTRRLAVLLWAALAAPALAMPGDPPVTSLSPDDGVTLQISRDGVTVGVGCPTYRDAGEDPFASYGYADDYRATASTQPDLGPDGVLADEADLTYPLLDGEQDETSTCHATFTRLQTPGTYYWQPWRYCTGCASGREVGPVRSFTLVADPDSVTLAIAPPRRAYARFSTLVPITVEGTTERPAITLQRLRRGSWVTVPSINALNFTDDHIARFPKGRYPVRARLSLPQTGTVTSPEKTITVKRSRRGTPRSDGAYTDDRYGLSVRVAKGGRRLKGFQARVPGTCPDGVGNLNPTLLSIVVPAIRIAPDGRFAAAVPKQGNKIHLSGRLHAKRLTGTVVADTGGCSGTISAFSADR